MISLLKDFPRREKAYIRAHVILEDVPPANAFLKASEALSGKSARFCTFKWERQSGSHDMVQKHMDVDQIRSIPPSELAQMHYRDKYGTEMDGDMLALLEEVARKVERH